MARGRGGRRQGVVGRAYGNRTDLTMNARPLPIATAKNQPYGEAGAQADAQRQIPLAPAPGPGAAGAPGAGGPPGPMPGSLGAFDRPSDRPGEPLTHGADLGPGGGQEVLGIKPPPQGGPPITQLLMTLAQTSGSKDIMELAQRSLALGGR